MSINPTALQLKAALQGDVAEEIAAGRGRVVGALGLAMEDLATGLVGKLRTDVERSGLSNANRLKTAAWRSRLYGKGKSLEPAAWIFSKLPVIVQAFENGVTIRAKGAKGLLIPNPDAWGGRMRLTKTSHTAGGLWAQATARFGELRVVKRPGKTTLVVAEVRQSGGQRGGYRRASASAAAKSAAGKASGLLTLVVFVIAKDAKLPRLLKGATIRERAQRDAPAQLDRLFIQYFTAYNDHANRQLTYARPARSGGAWGGFGSPPSDGVW